MKNTREFSEPPGASLNGHKTAPDGVLAEMQAGAGRDDIDREATRYLSVATQVDIAYAEAVVNEVMDEPFRALAPTFGIDVPLVVRWALWALRRRALRDYVLAGIFVMAMLAFVPSLWPQGLVLFPLALAAAWVTVSGENWGRLHKTVTQKMLRDRFDPASAPDTPKQDERERLAEVAKRREGNLVVFSGHSAFIGSGRKAGYQRVLLDVSRGKEDEDGKPTEPEPFTVQDLYTAIVAAFDCQAGLARSLPNIRAYERLFVNGMHVQNDPRLLPDRLRPPPTSVEPELLAAAARHPTPEARTYVCVEMPGWQGQLVVTMFIRAVHAGDSLYIDWTFRVLPPLRDDFLLIDQCDEQPTRRQLWRSLRAGLRDAIPALIQSPVHACKTWLRPYSAQRRKNQQLRAIKSGYVFDYGARESIREQACGTGWQHYFLARDEAMYVLLARETLTRAVELFLDDHKVDLGSYKEQVKVIFDNSIKVGDISSSTGVNIGNNSSTSVNESKQGEE
jgi:hypothetical protein